MAGDRRLATRPPRAPSGSYPNYLPAETKTGQQAAKDAELHMRNQALTAALLYTWQPPQKLLLAVECGLGAADLRRGAQLVKLLRDAKEGCGG